MAAAPATAGTATDAGHLRRRDAIPVAYGHTGTEPDHDLGDTEPDRAAGLAPAVDVDATARRRG